MSTLEIFGICFIVEIAFIVIALVLGLIVGKIDKINKENTYKHMMKFEEKLKNEKVNKELQEKDNKENITELGVLIPKGTKKTNVQKLLDLSRLEAKSIIYKNVSILNYVFYYEDRKEIILYKNKSILENALKTNEFEISISDSLNVQFNLGTEEKPEFVVKSYAPTVIFNLNTGDIKLDGNDDVDIQLIISCETSSVSEDLSEPVDNLDQNKLNDLLENAIQK